MGCGPQLGKAALRERNSNFTPCKPEVSATTLSLLTDCLKSQIHALKLELFCAQIIVFETKRNQKMINQ